MIENVCFPYTVAYMNLIRLYIYQTMDRDVLSPILVKNKNVCFTITQHNHNQYQISAATRVHEVAQTTGPSFRRLPYCSVHNVEIQPSLDYVPLISYTPFWAA